MSRYNNQSKKGNNLMLKIMFGVCLGIVLAGVITSSGNLLIAGALLKAATTSFQSTVQNNQQKTLSSLNLPEQQEASKIIDTMGKQILNNSRSEQVRLRSESALIQAKNETKDFNAIYKKPKECLDIKDNATRINCANAYIRARKAFVK